MIETISILSGITATIVSILTLLLAIFIALRSKQAYKSTLIYNNTLLFDNVKSIKKEGISTLIYGATIPLNSEVIFTCLHLLINNSKIPINNITLQLEYSSNHVLQNDELLKERYYYNQNEKAVHLIKLADPKCRVSDCREVAIIKSKAHVRCTIPSLRPGEKIIITDYMRFTNLGTFKEAKNEDYDISDKLISELKKVKNLMDFCVIDIYVYSDNCSSISKRLKLLWFNTNSMDKITKLTQNSLVAFWGGKLPTPGHYFWPIPKKLIIKENGEMIIPQLKKTQEKDDKCVFIDDPFKSKRELVILPMPGWNYFQIANNMDNYFLMKLGFVGSILPSIYTFNEHIKKILFRALFKGKKR